MNEESDGINENENNNSEVVILPERSHVEELLLSDQSQLREEQIAYERKLDEKLKDLGLYEDDMTINQKEELLAVVVISCETAEQEENKRQLIREYLEGAQSLEEEIEFSFQESAWLAGEANLLCSSTITRSKDENTSPTAKISFVDGEASTSREKNESFDAITHTKRSLSRNSPDIFQDDTAFAEAFGDPQSSTSEGNQKKHTFHKVRNREIKRTGHCDDTSLKVGISHPIVQEQDADKIETTEILDRQLSFQRQKLLLDKSMGCWKPCMSPKDKRLSDFRFKQKKEENASSFSLQEKFNKYLAAFEKTASSLKSKRSSLPKVTLLSKPYVLMHHGSVAKKSTKLDNYDYMIGVSEKIQNNEDSEEKFTPCNTLTRAKSAFHRVKPIAHGKLVSFSDQNLQNETTSKITRSGMSYGSKKLKSDQDKSESSPEVILDDSFNQSLSMSKDNSFVSEKHVTFHEDTVEDNNKKLLKFSDLRPDATRCKMIVPSPVLQKDNSQGDAVLKNNCESHPSSSAKKSKKEEAMGNRPEKDDSSDSSSSLIDVETIIEDDSEDRVIKRKVVPGACKTAYAKNLGSSKRVKKHES